MIKGVIIMAFTLREINTRLANEFIHLKEFCSYDENHLSNGIALKEKITGKVFCFKYYDLWRGRGNYSECKGLECKFYYYVDPRQTKITKFFDFDSQYPHNKEKKQ